jgi:preprotein translocase subunit SecA
MGLFEIATKKKYRFPYKGLISVEDLWDLNVLALDRIYKALNKTLKDMGEESLLKTKSTEEKDVENMVEIVKHIVSVKEQEKIDRLAKKENDAKKQRIMSIIADKEDKALTELSTEELRQMLDELG